MARMIPKYIHAETKSPGEHELFNKLRDDPGTKSWIVLHSLDIANHIKRLSGELDFVIIVPQKGVLCLEVKAANSIRRKQGIWYYGSSEKSDRRGPFKQASEAMHSIRQRLVQVDPTLSSVMFWSAVALPYVEFNIYPDEWHHWQVIDSRDLRSKTISEIVQGVLNSARQFISKTKLSWFDPRGKTPSATQCQSISQILRPDFEIYKPPRLEVENLDKEVKRFTEEQFNALDAMEANPRIIFKGPAGTGKTLLAIEAARRGQANNRKALLLCFNRLLGKKLETETSFLFPGVIATNLHKHMLNVAGIDLDKLASSPEFWQSDLPAEAIDKLLVGSSDQFLFDEIIIDEAQDLLRRNYLDFLDVSLRGGLKEGQWKLFGDFERQAIYGNSSDITLSAVIRKYLGTTSVYSLRINCRNAPRIASFVQLLSQLTPEYSKVLRPDTSFEPRILFYREATGQIQLLERAIHELREEGFNYGEIVVLSTRADSEAIASKVTGRYGKKLLPFEQSSKRHIGYCSIHSFKGLEKQAVIVTDVERIGDDKATSLFYVATTRALHRLYILANEKVKQDILRII